MRILRRLLLAALVVAAVVLGYRFAGANAAPHRVDLLFTGWEAPGWLVLLAAFGLGAFVVSLVLVYEMARLGLVTRRYRKAVRGLESEIHQLRNLPLAGANEASRAAAAAEAGAGGGAAVPGA